MNNEIFDEIERDEDETAEIESVSETLYFPIGNKSIGHITLAFTVPDDLPPVTVTGFTIAWTKIALGTLADIQKATRTSNRSTGKNLPYASLRGFLEVGLKNATRIQSSLGLSQYSLNYPTKEPEPFAYLSDGNRDDIRKTLRPILNDWLTLYLKPFADREDVPLEIIDRLEDLQDREEFLTITPLTSQILPWGWLEETGTTQHKNTYDYRVLVDYVARLIANREIFQGLGPIKRVISSSGSFTSGMAELITKPITLSGKESQGIFSLVVRLEVVTYPSLHQPLLKIDVSKRRWLNQLKDPKFDRNDISGFVFSEDYPDRAFSYKIICNKNENKKWIWATDSDFEALRRELKLSFHQFDGQQIALGKASNENCQVMLNYRNGLQEGNSKIKAGVPEIDKLEAFEAIATILKPFGLQPFQNYSPVKLPKLSHNLDDKASRVINLPTLLGAMLEIMEKGDSLRDRSASRSDFTPKYLEELGDRLNSTLNKHLGIALENIHQSKKVLKFSKKLLAQTPELKTLIRENQEALRRLYPNQPLLLVIFYEDVLQTEAKLLEEIVGVLWGGAIELLVNRLPENVHGVRELLPGKELNAKERSRHRIEAWKPLAQQIKSLNKRTFCLVMARDFYADPNKPDDRVNKPSTRQALAKIAGSCVQFILPIAKTKDKQLLKLDEFFHRAQSSLKDLFSAHSGRIDGVREKVDKWLKNIPFEARPKEIIGITIVRKQKGRVRGRIENTFLPIAMRLNVDTGNCELCCAYEKGNRLEISPWNSFSDAIAFISEISPVKLADTQDIRKRRFMDFVKHVISQSVEEGMQPLVTIDSSNCVQLWPWLADSRINANEIDLGQQYKWMQDEWKGARLIRIRQDLAPGIIDKKDRQLIKTSLEDARSKEEMKKLTSDLKISSASSPTGLFRLSETNKTGCVAYLSVGNKRLHDNKRGQSCYHSLQINTPLKRKKDEGLLEQVYNDAGLAVHQLATYPAFSGQWPTANPLEIVVTLRQPEDNPDCLAALVKSLRYGFGHYSEWTNLPAPLFFERVVRDYISEFALADAETEADSDLEEIT